MNYGHKKHGFRRGIAWGLRDHSCAIPGKLSAVKGTSAGSCNRALARCAPPEGADRNSYYSRGIAAY